MLKRIRSFFALTVLLFAALGVGAQQIKMGVCVVGDVPAAQKKVIASKLVNAITNKGGLTAVDFSSDITSGSDSDFAEFGRLNGVSLISVADCADVYGELYVSAKTIDVNSVAVVKSFDCSGPVISMSELSSLAERVANGLISGAAAPAKPVVEEKIFTAVEEPPSFPGGQEAMYAWMRKNLRYPKAAADNNIQGRVTVQFVVEKDGSIGDVKVVRGRDADLDREAVRMVKSMPRFIPGKMNGQPVRVTFTIPVNFGLSTR